MGTWQETRVAIVGGGLAGAALAWRLTRLGLLPTVFSDPHGRSADASRVSGGLVRGFDPDPLAARAAAESLAELRGSAVLRRWAGYREVGSAVLLPAPVHPGGNTVPAGSLRLLDELLPGSAEVRRAPDLGPFQGLAPGTLGVFERQAGFISPHRLREQLLAQAIRAGALLRPEPVVGVDPEGVLRTADGAAHRFDTVVLATGPWTPRLLAASGLPDQGLRTKEIQYTLSSAAGAPPGLGVFVDEGSGLYGRPVGAGRLLLGLPTDRWDGDPADPQPDPALAGLVARPARERLGLAGWPGSGGRTVAAADCYAPSGGLRLRVCLPGSSVLTFTGGTGGAAKYALGAARAAALIVAKITEKAALPLKANSAAE